MFKLKRIIMKSSLAVSCFMWSLFVSLSIACGGSGGVADAGATPDAGSGGGSGGGSAAGGGSAGGAGGGSAGGGAGGGSAMPVVANAKIRYFHADACNADKAVKGTVGANSSVVASYNKGSDWADLSASEPVTVKLESADGNSYGDRNFAVVEGNRYLAIANGYTEDVAGTPFKKKAVMLVESTPANGTEARLTLVNANKAAVDVYITGGEGTTGTPKVTVSGGFTQADPFALPPNTYRLIVTAKGDRAAILFDSAGTDFKPAAGDDLLIVVPPFKDCTRAIRLHILNMNADRKDTALVANVAHVSFVEVERKGTESGLDVAVSVSGDAVATAKTLQPGVAANFFTTPGVRNIKNVLGGVEEDNDWTFERGKSHTITARCFASKAGMFVSRACNDPSAGATGDYPY
jgi:hypothetical protein